MGILLQDTRYGLRNLVQTLGFIVVAMFMPLVDVISKLSSGDADDK